MQNVILVIHILACLALIGLVLVQKSEGGGLGIGGGGANSLLSARGAAGAIVRTTIIIGGIFFVHVDVYFSNPLLNPREKPCIEFFK